MNYVYVLKSSKDGKRYVGLTNNLERRINEHNLGKVRSTKNRLPLKLIYFENIFDRKEAAKREKFFKTGKGREFLDKVTNLDNAL